MIGNQVMTARVSAVESYRWWKESDEDWQWFTDRLNQPPNEKMLAGTAFHKALENSSPGEFDKFEVDGFYFNFSEFEGEIAMPQVTEVRSSKVYGHLNVTGKTDGISGNALRDYKLTLSSFDADRYLDSYQWRFYLDIFGADRFDYYVFEAYENKRDGGIDVRKMHALPLYRYPTLESDCMNLAREFYRAATTHPELININEDEL